MNPEWSNLRLTKWRNVEVEVVSAQARRALEELSRSIRENSPRINKKLCEAGIRPDPALVFSAAKYYAALNKLAKE